MRREGSVKQAADGTWGFVVDIAPSGAMRRQVRRRGFRTKGEAQRELTKVLHSLGEGTFVTPERLTLGEYLESWLAGLAVAGKRQTTITSYRERLTLHVLPRLGAARLQALTALDLDRLYAELLANGRRDGKGGLSPASVRYTHAIISKALGDARRKKLINQNPATDATAPSAKAARAPEMRFWTPEELRGFLAHLAMTEDPLLGPVRLAAMTGMRRGEVYGLHRDNLDLDAGRLRVRRQLIDRVGLVDHTKSDHGQRTLDLDPESVGVLRRHLAAQAAVRLAVGPGYADQGLVFAAVDGSPLNPAKEAEKFVRRIARAGVPPIRWHDLRHSHASHLLKAGVNIKVVSRRLGHASVSFTLDRYGHLMPDDDAAAAVSVAALVDGTSGVL